MKKIPSFIDAPIRAIKIIFSKRKIMKLPYTKEGKVYDLSGISDKEKDSMIQGLMEIAAKHFLEVYVMLGLKEGMSVNVENESTGDKFFLSFKKINYQEA